jgi:hypothetical protein
MTLSGFFIIVSLVFFAAAFFNAPRFNWFAGGIGLVVLAILAIPLLP